VICSLASDLSFVAAPSAGMMLLLQSVKTFEANDRLGYGFGAQELITVKVNAAKQGMKPAIAPNIKHQVTSIVVCPLRIRNFFKANLETTMVPILI
jgi:hypothetical protein